MNAPKLPPRAEAGVVIGGYELVRKIGRGGMAEVWVARRALGRKGSKFVAIKFIVDHHVGEERYARMFRAEAELAATLSHANIVQVFDEGEDAGRAYIVMEWVDGLNLLKLGAVLALLDDERRRFRVTAYIIGQLLYALGYAHSITSHDGSPLGVVHRDVSPQNVLVSNHGEVKLTDFGVAHTVMEESSGIHVKGKVRYMAPEQLAGKTRSPTVDLYAVGALLHELLDGKKFRGGYDDGQDLFAAVFAGEVPPLCRPAPPELDDLRLRLLEADPLDRVQTAEEGLELLQRYPDYGDARADLTKLCGSLTGVLRPRAGPAPSAPVTMARAGSGRPLARPQVNLPSGPAAVKPGARLAIARPGPPPPPTNSITAVKDSASVANGPALTGSTQVVEARRVVPGKKRVFRSTPDGGVAASSVATPLAAPVAASPSSSAPIPVPVPATPSSLPHQPSANQPPPAPGLVQPSPSHPIATAVPAIPPTERLDRPGSSLEPQMAASATEVIDPNMILEVSTTGSGTDQAIISALALRDGTDTSKEIRPHTVPPTHSVNIQLRKQSLMFVGLGLVLMVVAACSITVTWWAFGRTEGEPDAIASGASEGSTPSSVAAAAAVRPPAPSDPEDRQQGAGQVVAVEPGVPSTVSVSEAPTQSAPSEPLPGASVPVESPPVTSLDAGDSSDSPPSASPPQPSAPVPPPVAADSSAGDPATADPAAAPTTPHKKVAKGTVSIRSSPVFNGAQIRLGTTRVTLPRTSSLRLSVGRKKVKWRPKSGGQWNSAPAIEVRSDRPVTLLFTAKGPRVL